ncbi:MAG: hypothetical protein ACRDQY_17335, partial [Pseudonocardiaceae bacterium]
MRNTITPSRRPTTAVAHQLSLPEAVIHQRNSPRRRGMTEQAADAAVDQACRMLRLPTIRTQFPELAE